MKQNSITYGERKNYYERVMCIIVYKVNDMIHVEDLWKSYSNASGKFDVLKGITLNIPESKFVTILGPSGSGKTTLLNIIAGLEPFDKGKVSWKNNSIGELKKKQLEKLRVEKLGYVFQEYFLLNNLSLLENVYLAAKLTNNTKEEAKKALEMVGLGDHIHKLPDQLSGGQKQRVAIARAIVKKPNILICDEPTGALDTKSSCMILELIKKIQVEQKTTIVMVTHNEKIAKISDCVINLKDGKIRSVEKVDAVEVSEVEW